MRSLKFIFSLSLKKFHLQDDLIKYTDKSLWVLYIRLFHLEWSGFGYAFTILAQTDCLWCQLRMSPFSPDTTSKDVGMAPGKQHRTALNGLVFPTTIIRRITWHTAANMKRQSSRWCCGKGKLSSRSCDQNNPAEIRSQNSNNCSCVEQKKFMISNNSGIYTFVFIEILVEENEHYVLCYFFFPFVNIGWFYVYFIYMHIRPCNAPFIERYA